MTISERKEIFKTIKAGLKGIKLPDAPFKLGAGETIMDCKKFVESHILIIENNIDSDICLPYLERLQKFAEMI